MLTELTATTLRELCVAERKKLIYQQTLKIDATHITDEELNKAYKLAKVLSPILVPYFQYQIEQDNQNGTALNSARQSVLIYNDTVQFKERFIEWLKRDFEIKKARNFSNPSNLFELCGATLLITSKSVTRTLSTKMGHLWEKIANISPYVIIPEIEFGINIKGVDIIIYTDSLVSFAQLKTLKGTLTGSQAGRAIRELILHENPLFLVAFDLGNWTFPLRTDIPRFAGKAFWNKIHIDYNLVERHIRDMLQEIDKSFAELAANQTQNT